MSFSFDVLGGVFYLSSLAVGVDLVFRDCMADICAAYAVEIGKSSRIFFFDTGPLHSI